MKSLLLAGVAFALSTSMAVAFEGDKKMEWTDEMKEWKAGCEAAKAEGSTTDCKCLTKKAFKNADVKADLDAFDPSTGIEGLGEAGKKAVAYCSKQDA